MKTSTVLLNLIFGDILVCRVNSIHVTLSTGGRVCRPCIAALWPSNCHLWGRNHYFSKGAVGLFVWCGLRVLYGSCGRMLRARWSMYACECVCALSCVWHGRGTSVKGPPGQTFGCPWQCTPGGAGLVQGPLPSPPFPRTKARAQLKDVNSVAFVPKAQRHAEWEIWPLVRVRLCFWTPLAVSGSSGQRVSERMGGDGVGVRWRGVESGVSLS